MDEWVCVEPEERTDGITFYARNLRSWPLTLTFRAETTNLVGPTNSLTVSLQGEERIKVATFTRKRNGKRYRYQYWFDWTVGLREVDHDDDYLYQLPFPVGKRWRVVQGFGSRFSHTGREHYAVDFDMPVGSQVSAARDGVVVRVREQHNKACWEKGCGRYANFIVILHDDGTTGEYYHLKKDGALVDVGDRVRAGQPIALSGNTGHSTMPHLHFAVYRADTWGRTQSLPFRFGNGGKAMRKPRSGQRLQKLPPP